MVENILIPLVLATLTGLAGRWVGGRNRATLERQISFYGQEEAKHAEPREKRYFAGRRIRCQARLNALDQVRGTAGVPAFSMLVGSGALLFMATMSLTTGAPVWAPGAFAAAGLGFVTLLAAVVCVLALDDSLALRSRVIEETLAGDLPCARPFNPLPELRSPVRGVRRFVAAFVALALAPMALATVASQAPTHPERVGFLIAVGIGIYTALAFRLWIDWRMMDTKAVEGDVSERALERFSRQAEPSTSTVGEPTRSGWSVPPARMRV